MSVNDDFEVLMDAVRAHVARRYGRQPRWVTIGIGEEETIRYLVHERLAEGEPESSHSEDFRSVCWKGRRYTFTATQARVARVLWQAWEQDIPEVAQEVLLREADSDCTRLQDLFKRSGRMHEAWGPMIAVGERLGAYRLAGG